MSVMWSGLQRLEEHDDRIKDAPNGCQDVPRSTCAYDEHLGRTTPCRLKVDSDLHMLEPSDVRIALVHRNRIPDGHRPQTCAGTIENWLSNV